MSKRYASGRKALRQSIVRRLKNRQEKSTIRTFVKKALVTVEAGQKEPSIAAFNEMSSVLDKGVKHGLVHKNQAARQKARLAKKIKTIS